METTPSPSRAGLLGLVISFFLLSFTPSAVSQPTITVRFANTNYDCTSNQYCVDVEFLSDQQDVQLFGMNVRFFYNDTILEFLSFTDFQAGYGPFTPDPPTVGVNGPAGPLLFNFVGPAAFVNGAVQLADTANALTLDTAIWTKIFQICFTVDDAGTNPGMFCPSLVWDLEQDPAEGGFLIGDDGVVITIVSADSTAESAPTTENVVQYNWMYTGDGSPPFGEPIETTCINADCSPMLDCAADITLECNDATDPVATGTATATDICDGDPIVTYSDVTTAGSCPAAYTITRTWVASNACDLTDTCIQTITVVDTLGPDITCPTDITVECAISVLPANPAEVIVSDSCQGLITVDHAGDEIINQVCSDQYQILRTYVATDACGNTAFCVQTITVEDEAPPTIICPEDITVSCANEVPLPDATDVTVEDNCSSGFLVVHLGDVISNMTCPNQYTLNRTYLASDLCGNSASCTQVIIVFDSIPPAIICPEDTVINIEDSTSPMNTGMATGTDNCGGTPTFSFTDGTIEGSCANSYIIQRTWTGTDLCGNSSSCVQSIIVNDNCLLDLSLDKNLNPGQVNIQPGDNVDFTIFVYNDGGLAVGEIHITDYIPLGFTLNDPDWTAGTEGSTGQSASIILSVMNGALQPGGLQPGENASFEITLQADLSILQGQYENIAEISFVFDVNGVDVSGDDVDSDPDEDDTNDPDAEDDHDIAIICIIDEPVINGPLFVCPGDLVTYTVANYDPSFTYTFTLVNGGGQVFGTTPSSITILWDSQTAGPFEISVLQQATAECLDSSSIFVNVEIGGPIACITHTNISIDNACGTVILSGMILTGEQAGNNTFQVYIIDMNGDTVPNATLTWEHIGQTFKVSIVSICSGQSCWGFITVEDKLPPIINCVCGVDGEGEENCTINCLQVNEILDGHIPEELRPFVEDNCGGGTLEVINIEASYAPCINGYVLVTWKATDQSGNTATCTQQFDIVPITLETLQFPPDFIGECHESSHPDHTGWPQIEGMDLTDNGPICNIFVNYFDSTFPQCGGGRKIIRTWIVRDWCGGRFIQDVQTIKLADHLGPQLTCTPDLHISTDPWYCYTNLTVPKPLAIDACSDIVSYKLTASAGMVVVIGNSHVIQQLPVGTHTATWTVRDECHNSSTCSFTITVADLVPPVVTCHRHTVVSLTSDRPNGVTLVPSDVFSDGSFDNCSNIIVRARRMTSCIDFNWTTEGACVDDTPGGIPPVNANDMGTSFGSCVPFACCDIGQGYIMVEIEIRDEAGNVNYCMVEVEVQDKLAPELICAEDIYVSCEFLLEVEEGRFEDALGNQDGSLDEDPLSAVFGNMYDASNHTLADREHIVINDPDNPNLPQPFDWGLEGWASDNCPLALAVEVRVISDCSGNSLPGKAPPGAVKLIERRFSAFDGTQSGSCLQRIWLIDYSPFYIQDTTCNNTDPLDGVIWPCDVVVNTCPDDIGFTGEPVIFEDGCSLIGVSHEDARFDFAEGACFKILRTWKILDWCQFNPNTGYGLWTYVQTIKVADTEVAEFLDAPTGTVAYCLDDPGISLPENNQVFLGENDPASSSCSVHVDLGLNVHEACSESILYDVKIYLFNGPDFIQLVPETEVDLDENHEAEIRFNTEESSMPSISLEGLPYTGPSCDEPHRVLWTVEDGCGNRSYADYLFRLEDCKDPTPVCIEGLSTMIMAPEGEVTIWASDFDASSYDDCTSGEDLLFSFSGTSYQPSFTYTCDNVPEFDEELPVEIWAVDEGADLDCDGEVEWNERNKDFCITTIIINDINNVCDNEGGILTGEILTEQQDAVGKVVVSLSGPGQQYPEFITSDDGKFSFTQIPMGTDYTITPIRNDDHRNGINTLDLVHIQKHLLGQDVFSSPYQYIAADANNSQSISAIDIVEIRKLILGVQEEFSSNQSWRFVQEGSGMAPGNPWPFNEQIELDYLEPSNGSGLDFVGVKVGDVNNTVQANAQQVLPRSGKRVLNIKATGHGKIEAGEMIVVDLEFPEMVGGFQWTMEIKGLEYMGISSEDIAIQAQHVAVHEAGLVSMSWNGDVSTQDIQGGIKISLQFKVTQPGKLIQMMDLNGKVTHAEAYTPEGETMDVNLTFNSTEVIRDFALYQNKPNPWNHQTTIGFHIPEAAFAMLTVYDVDGKEVKTISGQYKAGYNAVTLSIKDIPVTGVLYYRLESGAYSASKKMVVVQ